MPRAQRKNADAVLSGLAVDVAAIVGVDVERNERLAPRSDKKASQSAHLPRAPARRSLNARYNRTSALQAKMKMSG